ncbi:GNAT family N-acetyltransferase [Paenibacillus sp. NEAU-GSW1]|uniref:GNAT family N-acetyltransferase n=1 Tax=Paenibacillus sp. NEAU-GSW1 TaxID=2682486 RepID=UPI0012E2630D|nr:GNAT family protein [Paenibacillus sp. NEAU-GSW1]MUT67390.1 GNAT family N-acetyltransferase [Paenibacillus sp. NEAU-GSW1]
MDYFPELQTERLMLRQLTLQDADAIFHYFSSDEVTRYYDLDSFTERSQAVDIIQMWNDSFTLGLGIRWAICLKEDPTVLIGTCGYHTWKKEHCKAEIGYELTPERWNHGIMTEAVAAIIPYGFEVLGLNRIEALIDPSNEGSRRLLLKNGLTEEGLLRDYYLEKGQFVDAVVFSILKREHVAK